MTPTAPSVILSGINRRLATAAREADETARFGCSNAALTAHHIRVSAEFRAMSAARETARQHLFAITPPDAVDAALTEADRRSREAGMDLVHAYTSVAEDIATGRWDPR